MMNAGGPLVISLLEVTSTIPNLQTERGLWSARATSFQVYPIRLYASSPLQTIRWVCVGHHLIPRSIGRQSIRPAVNRALSVRENCPIKLAALPLDRVHPPTVLMGARCFAMSEQLGPKGLCVDP